MSSPFKRVAAITEAASSSCLLLPVENRDFLVVVATQGLDTIVSLRILIGDVMSINGVLSASGESAKAKI